MTARKFVVVHDDAKMSRQLAGLIRDEGHEAVEVTTTTLQRAKGCHYAIVHENLHGREPDFSNLKLDERTRKFLLDGRTPEETIDVMRNPKNYGVNGQKAEALTKMLCDVKFSSSLGGLAVAGRLLQQNPRLKVIITGGGINEQNARKYSRVRTLRENYGNRAACLPINGFLKEGAFSPEKLKRLFEEPRE